MGKNIAIFWSGGLDSTALVHDYLNRDNTDKIYTFYSTILNNETKTKSENVAINNIKKIFEKYPKYQGHKELLRIESYNSEDAYAIVPPRQFLIFLTSIGLTLKKFDEVLIGYVEGDCAVSYDNSMKKLYNTMCEEFSSNCPTLRFPYIRYQKDELIECLPDEILQHVVWCENPKYVKKGKK